MNQYIINILIVIVCSILIYMLFRKINLTFKEGLDNNTTSTNGIASNASTFSASLKNETIKLNDVYLINNYKSDYESMILNLDDYLNILLLQSISSFDTENPNVGLTNLSLLHQSKLALNSAMKFVDNHK